MSSQIKKLFTISTLTIVIIFILINLSDEPIKQIRTSSSLVTDMSATVEVEKLNKLPKASDFKKKMDSVNFISESFETVNVYIPFRTGSVPFFSYQFSDVNRNDKLQIKIIYSREVYLFKNNKIMYTHRYEEPVFYVKNSEINILNSLKTQMILIDYNYKILEDKNMVEGKIMFLTVALAICAIFLGFTYRRFLLKGNTDLIKLSSKTSYQFILISISVYLILFLRWAINDKDPVGAKNLTPFGPTGPLFSDFFQINQLAMFTSVYDSSATNYPPFSILLLKSLSFASPFSIFCLIIFISLGVILGNIDFKNINGYTTMLAVLLSYPLLFSIARGNLDLLASALIILAISALQNDRHKSAVVLLSFAISLKLWPAVFMLLFLKKRHILAFYVFFLTNLLSYLSIYALGYSSISKLFSVLFSALSSGNASTSMEFQNTYSLKTIFVLVHMLMNSPAPWSPSNLDFLNALNFANGFYGASILIALCFVIGATIYISKDLKYQLFLASCLVLLVSSPAYIYRGVILIYAFQLLYKGDFLNRYSINLRFVQLDSLRLKKFLWTLIFVPTSFFYFSEKAVSTSSLIVPLSLASLLMIYGFEVWRAQANSFFVRDSKFSLRSLGINGFLSSIKVQD